MRRTKRPYASPSDAYGVLAAAEAAGYIYSFERLYTPKGIRWKIEVPGTRYETYENPDVHGWIILTTREVFAFIEGTWAVAKVNPVHRAGSDYSGFEGL